MAALLLVVLAGASCWLTAFPVDTPDGAPEFYFTRLAYSEDGSRGFGQSVGRYFKVVA